MKQLQRRSCRSWLVAALIVLPLLCRAGTPAVMLTPPDTSTLTGASVTFTWDAGVGVQESWLQVGLAPGNPAILDASQGLNLSAAVNALPTDGSPIYVSLWSRIGGVWFENTYTYTAFNDGTPYGVIVSPAPGRATLGSSSETFVWTDGGNGTDDYWLRVSFTPGERNEIYDVSQGLVLSQTVNALPVDGSLIYVRIYRHVYGVWKYNEYTYTAYDDGTTGGKAAITSPAPASTLAGDTVNFVWTAGTNAEQYWLRVGNQVGGGDIYDVDQGLGLTATVSNLPPDGRTVYVRLFTRLFGQWLFTDYTYTAWNAGVDPAAQMITPVDRTTLPGTPVDFTWTTGTGASQYWLDFYNVFGMQYSPRYPQALNTAVSLPLPTDGRAVMARLSTKISGIWSYHDYYYRTFDDGNKGALATMTSPAPGTKLSSASATFSWAAGAGATRYLLRIGTSFGGGELYDSGTMTNTSTTVNGLPVDSSPLYVRLFTEVSTAWNFRDYLYTAAGATSADQLAFDGSAARLVRGNTRLRGLVLTNNDAANMTVTGMTVDWRTDNPVANVTRVRSITQGINVWNGSQPTGSTLVFTTPLILTPGAPDEVRVDFDSDMGFRRFDLKFHPSDASTRLGVADLSINQRDSLAFQEVGSMFSSPTRLTGATLGNSHLSAPIIIDQIRVNALHVPDFLADRYITNVFINGVEVFNDAGTSQNALSQKLDITDTVLPPGSSGIPLTIDYNLDVSNWPVTLTFIMTDESKKEYIFIPGQPPPQGNFLTAETKYVYIMPHNASRKRVRDLRLTNGGPVDLTVTDMRVSWMPDGGEMLTDIGFGAAAVWSGSVASGTNVTLPTPYVLPIGTTDLENQFRFDSPMVNKDVTIQYTFSDTSTRTVNIVLNPASYIAGENWEDGAVLNGGAGWNGNWTITDNVSRAIRSGNGAFSGQYFFRIRRNHMAERSVDLSGQTGAGIKFFARGRGLDPGDSVVFSISDDGGVSYTPLFTWDDTSPTTYTYYQFDLSGYTMHPDFRIRFEGFSNRNSDQLRIDELFLFSQ